MPRAYPPMPVGACLTAALNDANNHWQGLGAPHNCGHQGTEYTTLNRKETVKTNWRNAPNVWINGTQYARRASDSMSALGIEIDLKLVPTANLLGPADFNYHIAIDTPIADEVPPPNIDSQKDNWRIMNNLRKDEYRRNHGNMDGYQEMQFKPW
jgi:hypothetical protein